MFALEPTPWVVGTVLELKSDTEEDEVVVNVEPQSPSPVEEDEGPNKEDELILEDEPIEVDEPIVEDEPIEDDEDPIDDEIPYQAIDQSDSSFKPLSESYTVTLNTEVVQPREEQDQLVLLMASISLLIAGFLLLCALMALAWYFCGVKKDNAGNKSQKIQKKKVADRN